MTAMMTGRAPMGARMVLRASPVAVSAGQVSFAVSNLGWRDHELIILPLGADASAGQRVPSADGRVGEAGSLGEASSSCTAGAGAGIAPASLGWTTVALAPGRYELLCNLPNHYIDGMYTELLVK